MIDLKYGGVKFGFGRTSFLLVSFIDPSERLILLRISLLIFNILPGNKTNLQMIKRSPLRTLSARGTICRIYVTLSLNFLIAAFIEE